MTDPTYLIGALAGLVVTLTGAYAAWRKLKPETAQIVVTSAEKVNAMTLEFAGRVGEENNELQREIADLRAEFHQYRRDTEAVLSELKAELRAERAEKEAVKRENETLLERVAKAEARVTELEAEVARLKGKSA